MTARLTGIWRHPIKAHGREALERVGLTPGATLPWDRAWAVAHEAAAADGSAWAPCSEFTRGAKAPALMAITAALDPATETVTLRHPERPALTFRPDHDGAAFLDWVRPLMPEGRAAPARLVRAPGRGMTDTDFPSISICNHASHRAVEGRHGRPLSPHRWRGNLWVEGLAPWEEFDLVGREIRVGAARLRVVERTGRCRATTANPETGRVDVDTLALLREWGHEDFAVYAEVVEGGEIAVGDRVVPA
ncbi:MOSC domain-containing protein [Rhodosalinus sediminis]|uniref:MOSC domain-containing protein n=1 Tax=Rhodosalinus sediminis TaxID=1940533 RepID=UPI00235392B6|nr:MOSC N-terminal beta barrel domain-containing protein [Rhodosalinus sediminis]